mmetsp:Transcript_33397/g.51240  ORF Transcript_33397/g.51240 Transcript_33397/m.51240 type:complete len:108 (-) Transcript_33397:411-734(-)|eukprot:CAMPEP_0170480556 /NCGR_PEP_ID=MMETSP0208-20121228/1349_1 /TAXON_ID=197538 /ORGANISM="Strombidium inclinatum, Strain S3" /LENGTH=107 /DNA_ID=CAMNT_0010753125 /DNA_START=28 /DNA_END=351 /DNA_ORIENTATION=+
MALQLGVPAVALVNLNNFYDPCSGIPPGGPVSTDELMNLFNCAPKFQTPPGGPISTDELLQNLYDPCQPNYAGPPLSTDELMNLYTYGCAPTTPATPPGGPISTDEL